MKVRVEFQVISASEAGAVSFECVDDRCTRVRECGKVKECTFDDSAWLGFVYDYRNKIKSTYLIHRSPAKYVEDEVDMDEDDPNGERCACGSVSEQELAAL